MKISAIKVGDRLENYRTGAIYVVTEIGCYHGDEIAFTEVRSGPVGLRDRPRYVSSHHGTQRYPTRVELKTRDVVIRRRLMTFKQFERLKFIRREGDRDP